MSAIVRFLFPLIGYFCTATVVAAAMGAGLLRYTGRLNDERMFQLLAVVHDVDLEEVEQAHEAIESEIPPEEASFDDQQQLRHVATLQFDAKLKQLDDLLSNFTYQLDDLNVKTGRYENLRTEVENYLKQQSDEAQAAEVRRVIQQMEVLDPRKQAKPLVQEMIKEGRIDTVIQILGSMKTRARNDLLKAFDTAEDIEMLYQIQRHMLEDDPTSQFIRQQVQTLEDLKSQDK